MKDDTFSFLDENVLDGIWYWDLEQPDNEYMSPGFWKTFGIDPQSKQHLAKEWQEMIDAEHLKVAVENFNKHCADSEHPYDQIVRYTENGQDIWVRCRGKAIRDSSGKPRRLLGIHTLMTEQIAANDRYESLITRMDQVYSETKIALLEAQKQIDAFPGALIHVDLSGYITSANISTETMFGYSHEQLLSMKVEQLIPTDKRAAHTSHRKSYCEAPTVREMGASNLELKALRADGSEFDVDVRLCPIETRRGPMILAIVNDVTEKRRLQREVVRAEIHRKVLLEKSHTDPLTNLYNRQYFIEKCESIFRLSQRNQRHFSMVMIDIDNFKKINDQFGHAVGDQTLIELTRELKNDMRDSDIIARYGGEEIVIALPETDEYATMTLLEKLTFQLKKAQPFESIVEDIGLVTFSAGISTLTPEIKNLDELINLADEAMYQAKNTGKNKIVKL